MSRMTGRTMRRLAFLIFFCLPTMGAAAYAAGVPSPAAPRVAQTRQPRPASPASTSEPVAFLFGETTIEPNLVASRAGVAKAFSFHSGVGGTASAIEIYVGAQNHARRLLVGLYSDRGGPTRRLASGSLSSPHAGAWNSVELGRVAIRSGRTYWVSVLGARGPLSLRAQSGHVCASEASSMDGLDALPVRWQTARRQDICHVSAYVVGAAISNGGLQTTPITSANPTQPLAPTVPGTPTVSTPTVSTPTVSNPSPPPPVPPINNGAPAISGDPTQGQTLTTSNGSWTGSPTSYTYQWQDCDSNGLNCTVIGHATSSTYVLASGDVGHTVRSVVTATNAGGSTAASSAPTGVVGSLASNPNPGNGLSSDPSFFPVMVFYQGTANVSGYQSVGVNVFESPEGYSSSDLAALKAAGMIVIECSVNGNFSGSYLGADGNSYQVYSPENCADDGRGDPNGSIIKGWMDLPDEPDTAQQTSSSDYGPCVSPTYIQNETQRIQAGDSASPKRAVMLNFNGDGVVFAQASDRGSYCDNDTNDYVQYMQGATIASFDIYPRNYGYPLDSPSVGVRHLHTWLTAAGDDKPVVPWIETTAIHSGSSGPSAADLHFEIWSSIIAGANGIGYFCHILSPNFNEAGCLSEPSIKTQMSTDDAQIKSLAPVLNSGTITPGVTASASFKVDVMTKQSGGNTYALSDADDASGGPATFTVPGGGTSTVTVLGENRTIPMINGTFTDSFGGYGVHLYQITGS